MTVREFAPLGVYEKDTNESRLVLFDWDTDGALAVGVGISTSVWTIYVERPSSEVVAGLTKDNASIVGGSRKTQVRIIGGTLGSRYRLSNTITTNEIPAQIKERSIIVDIVDR